MKKKTNNKLILARRRKQMRVRMGVLGFILVIGMIFINHKTIFASRNDLRASADTMSTFIIAEYQNEGRNADLEKICKTAKNLDKYGLRLAVDRDGLNKKVRFFKDQDPEPILVKELIIAEK